MGPWPEHSEVVADRMAEILRRKTGAERLATANGLYRTARQLVAAGVRARNPGWDEDRVQRETARLILTGSD